MTKQPNTMTLRQASPEESTEYLASFAALIYLERDGAFDPTDERSLNSLHDIVEASVGEPVEREIVAGVAATVFTAKLAQMPFGDIFSAVLTDVK